MEKTGIPDDATSVICVGLLNGHGEMAIQAKLNGIDFYHIDKAYFNRCDYIYARNKNGWWRVTKNDFIYMNVFTKQDENRYQRFFSHKFPLRKITSSKKYVLAIPPSSTIQHLLGVSFEEWENDVRERHKNQKIKIRYKFDPLALEYDLMNTSIVDCYHTSAVKYNAIMLGIPVVGYENIDKYNMCCALSNSQFTIEEFQNGYAWEMVKKS